MTVEVGATCKQEQALDSPAITDWLAAPVGRLELAAVLPSIALVMTAAI